MCVTIHVPWVLRQCSGGALELSLPATSLRDALGQIERRHPALYRCVCDETGAVRRHVNLFVNADDMRTLNGLDTPLAPGDTVMILPAVSGGWTCRTGSFSQSGPRRACSSPRRRRPAAASRCAGRSGRAWPSTPP